MAQGPTGGGGAEFVRRIVNDPKSVPDVVRLQGYLGASSEEGHERLYLSADLSSYVEIPKDAILHQMDVPAAQDPHGAVVLWVKKDAALQYKMAPGPTALAHYFAGALAGAGGGAPPAGAALPAGAPIAPSIAMPGCTPLYTRLPADCLQTQPNACTILVAQCGGPTLACPTHQPTCLPVCTQIPACQHTHVGQASCAPVCTVHTCAGHATCAPVCTVHTCVGHATCAPILCSALCTHPPACHPTLPPACHPTLPPACHPTLPPVCHPTLPPACHQTLPAVCHPSLAVVCHPTLPAVCQQSAVIVCHPTLVCPLATAPACPPPQSIACGSIACGVGGVGPGGVM